MRRAGVDIEPTPVHIVASAIGFRRFASHKSNKFVTRVTPVSQDSARHIHNIHHSAQLDWI